MRVGGVLLKPMRPVPCMRENRPFSGNNKIAELRKRMVEQTKHSVSAELSGPDAHVIRGVQTNKNLEAIFNVMFEQTLDWYALHFPELRNVVKDPSTMLTMIVRLGDRKNYSSNALRDFFTDELSLSRIPGSAMSSSGGSIEPQTLKSIQSLAQTALAVKQEQSRIQEFTIQKMKELAPNFSELATPIIAAQLLGKAGSLKRLAELPASTIQVLGAEEALFSHIKSHTRPPKHGFLFNHPLVKPLPKHARGRMARTLAGKLAICVRVDTFGKERVVELYRPKLEALSRKLAKAPFKSRSPRPMGAPPKPTKFRTGGFSRGNAR